MRGRWIDDWNTTLRATTFQTTTFRTTTFRTTTFRKGRPARTRTRTPQLTGAALPRPGGRETR